MEQMTSGFIVVSTLLTEIWVSSGITTVHLSLTDSLRFGFQSTSSGFNSSTFNNLDLVQFDPITEPFQQLGALKSQVSPQNATICMVRERKNSMHAEDPARQKRESQLNKRVRIGELIELHA